MELVTVGSHLFSKSALDKLVADVLPEIPQGHSRGIVATVDADGAKVGAYIKSEDGKWIVKGAAKLTGGVQGGASLVFTW